jgi:hypothetical protein
MGLIEKIMTKERTCSLESYTPQAILDKINQLAYFPTERVAQEFFEMGCRALAIANMPYPLAIFRKHVDNLYYSDGKQKADLITRDLTVDYEVLGYFPSIQEIETQDDATYRQIIVSRAPACLLKGKQEFSKLGRKEKCKMFPQKIIIHDQEIILDELID